MKKMKRTNFYLTEKQLERLRNQAEMESVAVAEIVRRAVEVYLAWNDPTYAPQPNQPERTGLLSPCLKGRGFTLGYDKISGRLVWLQRFKRLSWVNIGEGIL
jgi:hypothetical protein